MSFILQQSDPYSTRYLSLLHPATTYSFGKIIEETSSNTNAKENASSDDLPPSAQFSQKIACGKRLQPTHGMSAVSPTNVHAARTSTTSKSPCEVSSDVKYEMGVESSKNVCERHIEMKHKTPPIPFEVSREPVVATTAGQRSRMSATDSIRCVAHGRQSDSFHFTNITR